MKKPDLDKLELIARQQRLTAEILDAVKRSELSSKEAGTVVVMIGMGLSMQAILGVKKEGVDE